MITKEICEKNKCPLVPPNCGMFFLSPENMKKARSVLYEQVKDVIWFSPRKYHSEDYFSWSVDADFPVHVSDARGDMRKLISIVACHYLNSAIHEVVYEGEGSLMKLHELNQALNGWIGWIADPDEDDDDEDDIDIPVVFKGGRVN